MAEKLDLALERIARAKQKKSITLDLSVLELTALPAPLFELEHLRELNLSFNKLTELPPEIGQLTHLKYLNLSFNQLTQLPAEIGQLTQLTELHLNENQLTQLPEEIGQLTQLTGLYLNSNQLTQLPLEIGQLTQLESLDLDSNQLTQLPKTLIHLTELKQLDIGGNYLTILPPGFSQLQGLIKLDLSMNCFSRFPPELLEVGGLNRLELFNNNINELPAEINRLNRLKRLSLGNFSEENIRNHPWFRERYKKYQFLYNEISSLPSTIGHLENLENLFLSNLQLHQLPPEIARLKKLASNKDKDKDRGKYPLDKGLALEGNRFDIADEMYDQNPAELIQYLLDLEKGKRLLHEAKIIFVGNGGAGKTSLVNRLKFNTFDEKESQTNGIVIEDWELPRGNTTIKLHLWDFGGQQIMHASHQFFMTRRSVYVLVIDPRGEDKHGDSALDYWLTLIRSYAGDSPVVVVLNKCENGASIDIPQRQYRSQYPQIAAFVETSCKTSRNIDEVKKALIVALADLKHLDDHIPASYFAVKEKLQEINNAYIDFQQYKKLCREVDPGLSENAMKALVGLLNDLGIMLNIPENRHLEDTQVLNPEWLTNGVYQVITSTRLKENRGRISFNEIKSVLTAPHNKCQYQTSQAQNIIVEMMVHFKLCYLLPPPQRDCFLVPAVLPQDSPSNLAWNPQSPLRFQYDYKTLPAGIIAHFIVRVLPLKRGEDFWRSGIVIEHNDAKNQALIRADHYRHTIYIEVTGTGNKRTTLSYICTTLETIHRAYSLEDIAPRGLVPLDESGEITIPYDNLLVMEEEQVERHFVAELRKYIKVKDVLEGVRSSYQFTPCSLEELADKISRGEIETVIDELYTHPLLKDSQYSEEIILLSGRWHSFIKEKSAGTTTMEQNGKEQRIISRDLLELVHRIAKGRVR